MSPEFEYLDREVPRGTFFDVIFAVILFLVSGFSAYTTYLGFSKDLPLYMSLPIAAIIGLGLLGINFKIREARIADNPLGWSFLVFSIVFVFSFISNTNAFYSRLIEDDIVREAQEEAWSMFDRESMKALSLIDDNPQYQSELATIAEVENELTKLREQITDPRNLGLGPRAQAHLRRIEELLETKSTDTVPPSPERPEREHEQYAEKLERHIRELVDERQRRGDVHKHVSLHDDVSRKRNAHQKRVDEKDWHRGHTDEMHRDLKSIENQVNRHLSPVPKLELDDINDKADEVGKFKYTWRNFVQAVSPVAIALSVILGALLDILAPMMSIAFYRPQYD